MATRAPTDFTRWFDYSLFVPSKIIKASAIDPVLDDLEYALDAEELIISDAFGPILETNASFKENRRYNLESKDMCDVDGVTNDEITHRVEILCWNTDGSTAGEIKISSANATASGSNTFSVATGDSAATWKTADINFKTNRNEDILKVEMRRTSGTAKIALAAVALFAKKT